MCGDVPTVAVAVFVDVIDGEGASLIENGDVEGDAVIDGDVELEADADTLLVKNKLEELLDETLGEPDHCDDFEPLLDALGDVEKLTDSRGLVEMDTDEDTLLVGRGVSEKERVTAKEREIDTDTDSVCEREDERDTVPDPVGERDSNGEFDEVGDALPPVGLGERDSVPRGDAECVALPSVLVADLRSDAVPDTDDVPHDENEAVTEFDVERDSVSVADGDDDGETCDVRDSDGVDESVVDVHAVDVGDSAAEAVSELLREALIEIEGEGDGEFEFECVGDGRELLDGETLADGDAGTMALAAEKTHSRESRRRGAAIVILLEGAQRLSR